MKKYAVKIENYRIYDCQEILKKESPDGDTLHQRKPFVYFDNDTNPIVFLVWANSAIEAKIDAQEFLTKAKSDRDSTGI